MDDGHEGKHILLQVVLALGSPRRLASRLDGHQRKRRKYDKDEQHDNQLEQGKSRTKSP
jgi:hypothetical protein